jgi:hypothetical protein
LKGGKYTWERVIEKGTRRNGLKVHTEKQVMWLSCNDDREWKGAKGRTKDEMQKRAF